MAEQANYRVFVYDETTRAQREIRNVTGPPVVDEDSGAIVIMTVKGGAFCLKTYDEDLLTETEIYCAALNGIGEFNSFWQIGIGSECIPKYGLPVIFDDTLWEMDSNGDLSPITQADAATGNFKDQHWEVFLDLDGEQALIPKEITF